MQHFVSRTCLILSGASLGLWVCGFIVEGAGFAFPIRDWMSGFLAYAGIFFVGYRLSRGSRGSGTSNGVREEP